MDIDFDANNAISFYKAALEDVSNGDEGDLDTDVEDVA